MSKVRLAVILVDDAYRIHGERCRDILRDERLSDGGTEYIEVTDRHEANVWCWGDIASDNLVEGSPEWHAKCDADAAIASVFLACVKGI